MLDAIVILKLIGTIKETIINAYLSSSNKMHTSEFDKIFNNYH